MKTVSIDEYKKLQRRSDNEIAFKQALRIFGHGIPQYVEEYRFNPPKRSRFDFAWPLFKIAVEIDGGQWVAGGGRHNQDKDREKINRASALGWTVIRFSGTQIRNDPEWCIKTIKTVFENKGDLIDEKLRTKS